MRIGAQQKQSTISGVESRLGVYAARNSLVSAVAGALDVSGWSAARAVFLLSAVKIQLIELLCAAWIAIGAVVTLYVVDPNMAAIKVANYVYQTSQLAQTTLRTVLGEVELDELLSHRDKLNLRIQSIMDQRTEPFGVKVVSVEVKQVDLPDQMQRAMAKQAEAERERRSKIIHAEGEFSAAQKLVDAAQLLATQPITLQLRYLQTLTEIGVEKNTTIVFPLPVELLGLLNKMTPSVATAAPSAPVVKSPGPSS